MTTERTEDAERAVLGTVLRTSGKVLDELDLTGDDFYDPKRGDLFDAMKAMFNQRIPVEAFTLSETHPNEAAFLFSLTDHAVSVGSVPFYADIVKRDGLRRRLSAVGAQLGAFEPGADSATVAEEARRLVDEAIGQTGQKVRFVADVLPDVISRMEAKNVFVPSPWPTLNAAIGGFRPGAVYVVAARPGMGKTVVAAQIAAQLAGDGNVAFASLEMTADELVARFVAERLSINVGHIKDARMNDHDWQTFNNGRERIESLKIAIDDRSGVAASDVRMFARSVARNGKLAGVVVDYMQLMTSRAKMDRHLQVAEFSRQLKIMAKDFQVPVIALSQLNRNSEATALAVPKLSDLRESGSIEQDADVVMLLRRDGEYPSESLIIDVAKNRHGETGEVDLHWDGQHSRVIEWTDQGRSANEWTQ
jgi:replicative DNA helicase